MRQRRYASVYWTMNDILERAEESGIHISRAEATRLLRSIEKHLVEGMLATGWTAVEDALAQCQAAAAKHQAPGSRA